ncbi:MAG TPA: CvpA family protein [Candidatus Binatia bacterium]|jgi:hypothetical protein|nr:CvpA family protein [Candidatus Binatia bacterium]
MTIWLLALLLLASLAGLGYRQGAIRVAISFVGILLGAVVAVPLGHLVSKLLAFVGLKQPVLTWVLGPLIAFIIVSAIFKSIALAVHHKVDMHFKYHAGELRLALWERLNRRAGMALGLFNGTAYFALISFIIYVFSYWTVQMATSDQDPKSMRFLNQLGRDLQATGFNKVARAIESMPPAFFDAADVVGLVYHNPLTEARLWRYPAFLSLAERPELQALANDVEFTKMRQRQDPIMAVLQEGTAQSIVNNPDLMRQIWTTAAPDLKDLRGFLETGLSPRYDPETILGRWRFDVNAAVAMLRRVSPNISSTEMQKRRKFMTAYFDKTGLVAMADHHAVLKNMPQLRQAGAPGSTGPGVQTLQGEWKNLDGKYQLTFSGSDLAANVEGDRLSFKAEGVELAFLRED